MAVAGETKETELNGLLKALPLSDSLLQLPPRKTLACDVLKLIIVVDAQ